VSEGYTGTPSIVHVPQPEALTTARIRRYGELVAIGWRKLKEPSRPDVVLYPYWGSSTVAPGIGAPVDLARTSPATPPVTEAEAG
jgi:hypothetical protein